MKIAIVTDDQVNISQNFGRTLGFKIFEINNTMVVGEDYR